MMMITKLFLLVIRYSEQTHMHTVLEINSNEIKIVSRRIIMSFFKRITQKKILSHHSFELSRTTRMAKLCHKN